MLTPAATALTVMRLRTPLLGPLGKAESLKKVKEKSLQVAVSLPLPLLKSEDPVRTKLVLWPMVAPMPRGSSPPSSPSLVSASWSPSPIWVSSSNLASASSSLPSWTTAGL